MLAMETFSYTGLSPHCMRAEAGLWLTSLQRLSELIFKRMQTRTILDVSSLHCTLIGVVRSKCGPTALFLTTKLINPLA